MLIQNTLHVKRIFCTFPISPDFERLRKRRGREGCSYDAQFKLACFKIQSLSIAKAFNSHMDHWFAGLWYRKTAVSISAAFRRLHTAQLQDQKFCWSKREDGQPQAVCSQALSVSATAPPPMENINHWRGTDDIANKRLFSTISEKLLEALMSFS